MLPRELQSEKIRRKRIEAYINGKTCSHWSNKCELKSYPYGFKKRYLEKKLNDLKPLLINDKIPSKRYNLL